MRKATLLDPSRQKLKEEISQLGKRKVLNTEEKRTPKARFLHLYWKYLFNLILIIILFPLLIDFGHTVKTYAILRGAFVFLITIGCWLSESLPLPITALLPACLFPLLGIVASDTIVGKYFNDSILMLFGGMLLAATFEFSGIHKRIALKTIVIVGSSTNRLLFGIMAVTSILSCWMNNTAVTAMMTPIVLAILEEYRFSLHETLKGEGEKQDPSQVGLESKDSGSTEASDKNTLQKLQSGQKNPKTPARKQISPTKEEKEGDEELKNAKSFIMTEEAFDTGSHESKIFSGFSAPEQDALKKELALSNFLYNYKVMFLLATAYSANLGGTGLLIGSGTNVAALDTISRIVNEDDDGPYATLSFLNWGFHNVPPMVVNLIAAYFFLVVWCSDFLKRSCGRKREANEFVLTKDITKHVDKAMLEAYNELGGVTVHEIGVLVVFLATMLAWIVHEPKIFDGWKSLFESTAPTLATPAIAANILVFIIPRSGMFFRALVHCDFEGVRYQTLMAWPFIQEKFPWGIILLLGGGFALSLGFGASGLGKFVGEQLLVLRALPKEGILLIVLYVTSFMTECASNTAIAAIFVPILLDMARNFGIHPLYFALGSTVACSFSFMLPIATPPNAIVYTKGKLKATDMIKPGFFMNIITAFIFWLLQISWGDVIFGYNSYVYLCFPNNTRPNGSPCSYKGPNSQTLVV